ncbi:hypothetical protein LX36DRAFT_43146 [Colletotrichum falcatum]|nr:hypothetical protein LX36DRAFT_43146 [Colletotrichum falcatum]
MALRNRTAHCIHFCVPSCEPAAAADPVFWFRKSEPCHPPLLEKEKKKKKKPRPRVRFTTKPPSVHFEPCRYLCRGWAYPPVFARRFLAPLPPVRNRSQLNVDLSLSRREKNKREGVEEEEEEEEKNKTHLRLAHL